MFVTFLVESCLITSISLRKRFLLLLENSAHYTPVINSLSSYLYASGVKAAPPTLQQYSLAALFLVVTLLAFQLLLQLNVCVKIIVFERANFSGVTKQPDQFSVRFYSLLLHPRVWPNFYAT